MEVKIGILLLTALPVLMADAKSDLAVEKAKTAQLQAQLAAAQAQIRNQGVQAVSASASNGAAIQRLGQSQRSATNAQTNELKAVLSEHAQKGDQAVAQVQDAAQKIVDSNEDTKLEFAKLKAASPQNSVPVWLAAIAGIVSVIATAGSIAIAVVTRNKVVAGNQTQVELVKKADEIHTLTNSNLNKITSDLHVATERIVGLEALVAQMKAK